MTDGGPSTSELSRRMGEVLERFRELVNTVENKYVSREYIELYKETVNKALKMVEDSVAGIRREFDTDLSKKVDITSYDALQRRVAELEDNNKWLVRLVIGFIILGILGFVFANGGMAK